MGNCGSVAKVSLQQHQARAEQKRTRLSTPSKSSFPSFGLEETHEPVQFLGKGGTGETWCMREKATGKMVAVKTIKRPVPRPCLVSLLREITIQAQLGYGCVNIIDALDVYLTPTHLALVMDYAAGGNLTNYVADRWKQAQHTGVFVNEDEARYFMRQFILALSFCHEHCVAHRDLKLDNTLLDESEPPTLLLCDFGFSKTWTAEANMYTHIGTPVYMAPELVISKGRRGAGYNGRSVDVWAAGVLLCVLILGIFPFDVPEDADPTTKESQMDIWVQQMTRKWNELPQLTKALKNLSPECLDLLNRIFVVDHAQRITVDEIRAHPWFLKPLSPKFQAAWDRLLARQTLFETKLRQRTMDRALLQKRNKAVERLVETAASVPGTLAGDVRMHIDLRADTVLAAA